MTREIPAKTQAHMKILMGLAQAGVDPSKANEIVEKVARDQLHMEGRIEECDCDEAWEAGPFEGVGNQRAQRVASDIRDREQFEAHGFEFGPPDEEDPLFCEARFPPGWTFEKTDHHMWFKIKDDQGNERAVMFYKAAFYDRDAFLRWRF